jgi:phosphatidylethanolamine N-methyltransferase
VIATPKLSNYVEGTKLLIQQSGERFLITRMANVSSLDASQYKLSILPPPSHSVNSSLNPPILKFKLGEPITVRWSAPKGHSRQDWIGIYDVRSNKSKLVTTVASQGRWLGVNDEWEGDDFVEKWKGKESEKEGGIETGELVFTSKRLPWSQGKYEIRYHHDGKHNVMTTSEVFEVCGE